MDKISLSKSDLTALSVLNIEDLGNLFKGIIEKYALEQEPMISGYGKILLENISKNIEVSQRKKVKKKSIEDRKEDLRQRLIPFVEKYNPKMIREFFDYWTEIGAKDTKMRFEKEKSFGESRRLSTWNKLASKYGEDDKGKVTHTVLQQDIVKK